MYKQIMKLKSLRAERSLTQKSAAKILGVSQSNYAQKENGYLPFTQWEIEKMLKEFSTTYDEIFKKEEKRDYSHGAR